MTDYPQRMADTYSARKRLMRVRRQKEKLSFSSELRVVPKRFWILMGTLFVIAQLVAFFVNFREMRLGQGAFPPELRDTPALAYLAVAGIVTLVSLVITTILAWITYVNRDAKRRGMNYTLWTILVILLLPAWGIIGFVVYFLMREPLPYPCPQCEKPVSARFNFCPNCKCNLHPTCPQCKREVGETDRFCANCSYDLSETTAAEPQQVS